MRRVQEALQELLAVFVKHRVMSDSFRPFFQLSFRGQLAMQNQVRNLKKTALLGQLLDGVAAMAQDALVAVDEGDRSAARGGI